jgi:serpin B
MPIYAKAGNQEAAQAYGKTSMNLFREVVKKSDVNENIVISPDSIITAMTIVENGAAGKTLSEMKHAFGDVSVKKYNQYLSSVHQSLSSSKAITYKNIGVFGT